MHQVYVVPVDTNTTVMNKRIARFVADHMCKPYFNADYVEKFDHAVICQNNCSILGCALIKESQQEFMVECVCVHSNFRCQGIGSEIMSQTLDHCSKNDVVLIVDNGPQEAAIKRFYERLGFEALAVQNVQGETKMQYKQTL